MDAAITTTTANKSHVEALNGFVSMRTSIVVRHRNIDGVHRIALGVSAVRLPRPRQREGHRELGASVLGEPSATSERSGPDGPGGHHCAGRQ